MKKLFFSLSLLLIVHCTFTIENCMCQWYPLPQFPTYHEVTDVKFFDENTGVLTYNNYPSTYGIMRTTNGGTNWNLIRNYYSVSCQKIDSQTVYIITGLGSYAFMLRTFDKGLTWDSVGVAIEQGYRILSFVNKDTGWISGYISGVPYIWKTTNGGVNFTIQAGSNVGAGEIFFLKQKINNEYIGWVNNNSALWKTTNSGNSWFQVACPGQDLIQITFVDENTGWVSNGNMYKTTNGGLNWIQQQLAPGVPNISRSVTQFCVFDNNILIGVNGYKQYPQRGTALVFKSTNGGNIWGYQEIDTSYHIGFFGAIDFINPNTGWAFEGNGAKTTNGGGSFTSVRNNEVTIKNYKLFQNYPNPFNPETNICYNISNKSDVKIIVYDIIGKEIETLVNEIKQSGSYTIRFDANNLPSGIYFYQLIANSMIIETKKMIYLK